MSTYVTKSTRIYKYRQVTTCPQVSTSLQVSTRHTSTRYTMPLVIDDLHIHTSDNVTHNPHTPILSSIYPPALVPVQRNDHTQHPQSSHILQCLHVLQSLHILQSLQVYTSTRVYMCLQVYKCLQAYKPGVQVSTSLQVYKCLEACILSIHPIQYSFQTSTQPRRIRSSQH
jgi:hypothetical protein